ncbi:hypothetical protein [Streptacidiphilus carbonis]|jgi:hypothetical protein|uniref:hypothetical protein n=1 Tax=Streptacidiphilus carbonis TaxID=105422 RepID=UPI0005AB3522|nr:hypothetical protein [Streptacidiphilus carbonis]
MATVVLRTETVGGAPVAAVEVGDVPEAMTARELIRLRARDEFSRTFPDAPEHDRERQADQAERAFLANGFFLLVGDRQVLELDEMVELGTVAEVVFLRLVPLVGG